MVHLFYAVTDQFHIGCYKFVKLILDSTDSFRQHPVFGTQSNLIILPVADDWHTQSIFPSFLGFFNF